MKLSEIVVHRKFIPARSKVDIGDALLVGYFPYECAGLYSGPKISRKVFSGIEAILRDNGISDNKYVAVFSDAVKFGTSDFAIFFHDAGAYVGKIEDITGYAGIKL